MMKVLMQETWNTHFGEMYNGNPTVCLFLSNMHNNVYLYEFIETKRSIISVSICGPSHIYTQR